MFSRVAVVKLLLAARDESKTREGIFPPSFFPSTLGFLYLNHISTPGDHFIDFFFSLMQNSTYSGENATCIRCRDRQRGLAVQWVNTHDFRRATVVDFPCRACIPSAP